MLNKRDEQFFRTATPQTIESRPRNEKQFMDNMIEQAASAPMIENTLEQRDLLEKTKGIRRLNESVLEFVARIGISPGEIRTWNQARILSFVLQAELNARDLESEPPRLFSENTTPPVRRIFTVND